MRTLITGGAGFIGSAVTKKLQEEGHTIAILDNLSFGNRDFISVSDSQFHQADILNREAVENIFSSFKPQQVIHLAAVHFIPWCNEHPYEASDINIRGTIHVLDACKKFGVEKVFFASTAAVYPIYNHAVKETDQTGPLDIYGLTKLTGERLCNEFHLMTGIPTIVCRFFNAFGPNETNPHLIPEIQKQVNSGMRKIKLGNLTPKRDFIHTYDMANAVSILLKKVTAGIDTFNLGRGIEYAVTEIVDAFAQELNEKIEIEVDPARVRKVERMHLLADVSKLKSLGWQPEWGINEGIRTLIRK